MALGLSATFVVSASPAGADRHEGILPEGEWTEDQIDYALDLVERTHQELPAFDLSDAELEALGFVDFGVTAPGGYDHWINMAWLSDEHTLNPAFPESLVFRVGGGSRELVSAMFFLGPDDTIDDIPEEIAWLPGWHVHPQLCWDPATGQSASCQTGEPITVPMTHVWLEDPGCGHLFGGVDVGGLVCDVHGHDGGHGHEDPPPPGHEPPGHEPPGEEPPGNGPPASDPPGDDGDGGNEQPGEPSDDDSWSDQIADPSLTPPAEPVPAQPTFTG